MPDWKAAILGVPGVRKISAARTLLASWYFDQRHHVDTRGEEQLAGLAVAGDNVAHGGHYLGTTPRSGRHMLRQLPVKDFSNYVFMDFGSGKGRMLLIASELPFRRIMGIEFIAKFDAVARQNIKNYRNPQQKCFDITSLHLDATQFQFPAEPSIVYFYNPFDQFILSQVIENLDRSLIEHPRDVVLMFRNPKGTDVLQSSSQVKLFARCDDFGSAWEIYRSAPVAADVPARVGSTLAPAAVSSEFAVPSA